MVGIGPSDLQDLSSSISSILGFGVMLELDVVEGSELLELSPANPILPDSQLTLKVGAGPTGLGSFSSLSLLSLPLFELLAFEIELSVPMIHKMLKIYDIGAKDLNKGFPILGVYIIVNPTNQFESNFVKKISFILLTRSNNHF